MTRLAILSTLLAACFVAPYLGAPVPHSATPRSADHWLDPFPAGRDVGRQSGAPLVVGLPARGKGTLGETRAPVRLPDFDRGRLVASNGDPLKLPRLDASALDQSGPSHSSGTPLARRISGLATWYCSATSACTKGYRPSDMVAAIDSDLGFRKGQRVRVTYFGRSVVVRIVDVCGCAGDRLIDLTSGAFRRLAPLELGVIPVMLELAGPAPRAVPTAPATDR